MLSLFILFGNDFLKTDLTNFGFPVFYKKMKMTKIRKLPEATIYVVGEPHKVVCKRIDIKKYGWYVDVDGKEEILEDTTFYTTLTEAKFTLLDNYPVSIYETEII